MLLWQSSLDNLIIERIGNVIECRYGTKVIDTIPATGIDKADTRLSRNWIIKRRWNN
jgi:hypothetical protein